MKAVSILVSVLLGLMVLACAGEVPVSTVVDDTAPLVTSCLPAPAAVGQPRNVRLSITFDEALDSASVGTNSILLHPVSGGTAVRPSSVVLSADKKNVRVYLAGELAASTQYEVRLSKDIRNLAGLKLGDHSWRFTTGTQLTKYALDLAVTAPAEGTLVRSSLTLAGTLGPVAELASLQYAVNTTNGMLSWRPIEVDPAQAGAWSYKLYTWEESFVEGTNTVYLRAVNISNETSMARVAIRVDNTMPTVRLDWPPSNTTISGTVQLRGSVLDAGGIAEVAYRIGADDTWHSVTPTGTNWTVLVDTRTYPDSMRSVTVRAIDTARNTNMVSAVASQVLVDNWSGKKAWNTMLEKFGLMSATFGMDVYSNGVAALAMGEGMSKEAKYYDSNGLSVNLGYYDYITYPRTGVNHISLSINRYDGYNAQWYSESLADNFPLVQYGSGGAEAKTPKGSYFKQVKNDFSPQNAAVVAVLTNYNQRYILGLQYQGSLVRVNIIGNDDQNDNYGIGPSIKIGSSNYGYNSHVVYYNLTKKSVRYGLMRWVISPTNNYQVVKLSTVDSFDDFSEVAGPAESYGNAGYYTTDIVLGNENDSDIHVAYIKKASTGKEIWYARSIDGGSIWTKSRVAGPVYSLQAPSLAVHNGVAYVGYISNGKAYVAKNAAGYGALVQEIDLGSITTFGDQTRLVIKNNKMYFGFMINSGGYLAVSVRRNDAL